MGCTSLSQRSSKTRVAAKPAATSHALRATFLPVAQGRNRRRSAALRAGSGGSGGSLGLIGQLIRLVGAFPGELGLGASEVSVGGCLLIDRPDQVQHLAQPVGREIEI